MVALKPVDNRWLKRYRIFFFIGTLILCLQLFLAVRFFTWSSDSTQQPVNKWNPHRVINIDDAEVSANSARRSKDSILIDDEDVLLKKVKVKSSSKVPPPILKQQAHTKLRLEELDFIPPCEIVTKDAISAIHRAKTQRCKQEISNVTCLIQKGLLYPEVLPNFCPTNGLVAGESLGCFKDEKSYRLLSGYYGVNKEENSPEYCIRVCLQSGFPYAGVQYSTECFCGNDEPPSTAKLADSSCNMKCPADSHLICGGFYTVNVYQTGIKKFVPATALTTNPNGKTLKVVFLLTLNGRALRQVKRLLKVLYHSDHYFYIHVDNRQDYLFRELLTLEKQFPNVRLTRNRFAAIWGGASLLQMLLSCMKELLEMHDWQWDFVLNLSESDYPVKTVPRLVEFLSANRGKNFVRSHGREVSRFVQRQGLDKSFVECDMHMWRVGEKKIPWGIQIDGGSDWIALSRPFVHYVTNEQPDELIRGMLIFFKYTLLPAESFFHSVLRNSRFCDTYVDNNLHVTNWKRKLGCKCQYKHIVDWCGCSPNDFKPEDWMRILNTENRQLYFARKFEPVINQAVILQVERWLFGADFQRDVPHVDSYWQSIYNHLDLGPNVDDSLLTLSDSAIRLKNKTLLSLCHFNFNYNTNSRLLEIHSFHVNDTFKKILVLFEARVDEEAAVLETSFVPKDTLLLTKSSGFIYRIKAMHVSSDYDQKEQVSRNLARNLGPYSEPILIYTFSANSDSKLTTNVTFLWINPAGKLADVTEATIDDLLVLGSSRPNLRQPLLPGAWTVKVVHRNFAVAEVRFLVTPLNFVSGNKVAQNQVNFIHSGADIFKEFDATYDKFLPDYFERETLERVSDANARRFGLDLQEWIDTLFLKFYTLGDVCIKRKKRGTSCASFAVCKETDWSSLVPDPKSHIGLVNKTTGMLLNI